VQDRYKATGRESIEAEDSDLGHMVPPKVNPGSCRHLLQSDVVNLSSQMPSPSASELVEKGFFV
jgi:hypothetical protein